MSDRSAAEPLPVDALLPELVRQVREHGCVVLTAEPGAGKTTRVPLALLDALQPEGQVVVTEPRRLAARLAARYVAELSGSVVGGKIGYSVRFEDVSSSQTRLRYVTEGVLLRQLGTDPDLRQVSVVVVDEVHERHLATDELLALLTRLRDRRPELSLIIMSATLDPTPVQRYLSDCPHLHAPGKAFPLHIEHSPDADDRPLPKRVVGGIKAALRTHSDGDLLVFLPGTYEIFQVQELLDQTSLGVEVCPLYGDLSVAAQAQAVTRSARRRVVLTTNVAESSVTVDGVRIVIDAGLVKVASVSPWSGRSQLRTVSTSKNSAIQRAGRAARQGPGWVYRLYTEAQFRSMDAHETPEIERADLSSLLLDLAGAGVQDPATLRWLTPPPAPALAAARNLLSQLGATTGAGELTPIGRRMLELLLSARLARVLVQAELTGIADDGALTVALLSERDIRSADFRSRDLPTEDSDVNERLDRIFESDFGRHRPAPGLERSRMAAVRRVYDQLSSHRKRGPRGAAAAQLSSAQREALLAKALLAGFSDRVARRKSDRALELVLKDGSVARLSEHSVVRSAPFMLALDVEDRVFGRSSVPSVRLACAIEPDWLLEAYSEELTDATELSFDSQRERVESSSRLMFGSVTLEESRLPAVPSEAASELLFTYASGRKTQLFGKHSTVEVLRSRLQLLTEHLPELEWPTLAHFEDDALVRLACRGRVAFSELQHLDWEGLILGELNGPQTQALRVHTPERLQFRPELTLEVHYERGKPPWIQARIQDFFGQTKTPHIVRNRVPLTVHLLAPNRRAVQVTSDLDGFWTRHYAEVRKQLRMRYPRHHWPEDGRAASPPPPGRLKPRPGA